MAASWFCQGLSRPVWYDWIFVDTACEFVMRTRGGQARVHDRHEPEFRAIYRVVVLGALLTRSRLVLRWLHILSLVWGILMRLLPWPCPLTRLENWLNKRWALSRTTEAS